MTTESPQVIVSPVSNGNAPSTEIAPPAAKSMEGIEIMESINQAIGPEEGGDERALDTGGDEMQIGKKMAYADYLMSPIITIQVGSSPSETTLSAHLALLQSSPWLTEVCAEYSAETPFGERIIYLPEEDIDAMGAFLEYLYTKEYTPRLIPGLSGKPEDMAFEDAGDSDVDDQGDNLLKHAKVYTLAEKLRIPELKHLAHSKIHRINSTAKGELRYAKFVYENTTKDDDTIRKPIANFWAHRSHVLRHEAEEEFKSMVLEFPQFAYDILSIVLDQKEKGKEHVRQRLAIGAPTDDDTHLGAAKTPRTGRKRLRTSTVLV